MKTIHKSGFTLVEMVAVFLLVAILGTSIFISIIPMAEGLSQVRLNTNAAQKARLAMARMSRELTTVTNVVSSSGSSISYNFLVPAGVSSYSVMHHTLAWGGSPGDPLMLEGEPLCDEVQNFSLTYTPGPPPAIDLVLTMVSEAGGNTYSNRIIPRNILNGSSP